MVMKKDFFKKRKQKQKLLRLERDRKKKVQSKLVRIHTKFKAVIEKILLMGCHSVGQRARKAESPYTG